MDLKSYLSPMSQDQREEFARQCGTTGGHLRNVAYGKSCAPGLASSIEIHSRRKVTRQELRPSDWSVIWPELARRRSTRAGLSEHPTARARPEAKGRG